MPRMGAEMSIEAMKLALETEGLDAAIVAAEVCPKELRLFAVRCAREVQHLMKDQRSLDALDVAEKYARGKATDQELDAARAAAWDAARAAAGDAAWAAAKAAAGDAAWDAARAAARAAALERQEKIFLEIFNNAGKA